MGRGSAPAGDKLCLLSGLWPQGLLLSLSHEGLQFLKLGRAVPNKNPTWLYDNKNEEFSPNHVGAEVKFKQSWLLSRLCDLAITRYF